MKSGITIFLICTVFLAFSQLIAAEKVGTTSFQFLKVAPDARSAAMGNAFTSVVNTADAVFWNPAALKQITGPDIAVSYIDYFLDVSLSSVALGFAIADRHRIGLQAIMVNYGEIEVTDLAFQGWNDDYTRFNPGLTGEVINPSAKLFGLSYAVTLTDKFSFGVTGKYIYEDLVRAKTSSFCFDGGLIYDTGWKSVIMAATIKNFGPEVTFINEAYPIPETFTFGISGYLINDKESVIAESGWQSLLVSYDLSHPRDYAQQHNLGLEYGFKNFIFLRGGYKFNYDEEGLTLGLGLNINDFRLDYAYDPFGDILESVHRFSVGYTLN